ncbi:MAG: hypothetical protein LBF24_03580, partial [Puniceicoccales bacterium]|nr:hypothetical protein [Puniceicoccales bacterium]
MRKQSGRIDSLDHPIGMGVVHHRINFLLCLFCELPLAGMALAIEGGGQHWEIPFPKEFFYASQLQSPPSPSATLRSTFPTALEEVAAISDDGVWHCVLGAMAAERDGFSCLARDRWEMAEDMADRLGFGEGVKEFHSHAIAHLLPPSEAAVARMRRCWEKGKRRRDLERCLILLARLDRKEEARRLLGQQLDDDRAGGVVDPQLALLGALLWPEDTDQFGHLLRRALIEDGPASVRVAVLRLLVRQPGGEDLSPFLAVLPEAADRELGAALRLARLELALRDGDWPLAKTLAGILFRENGTDSERREGFLRLWLWLALERVPTDYGKIAALLRNSDSTGTERRTIHLALAAHYLRQGNCSLAQRFLGKCGPLDQKELALQT